jgi:hypothetical protein
MTDLVVTEADLQSLSAALVMTLNDLEALRRSLRHTDVSPIGAPPLMEEEEEFARTRDHDLTLLGEGIAGRHDDVERVVPELRSTDHRVAGFVQREEGVRHGGLRLSDARVRPVSR